ncbi:hypothetical protein PLESTB_000347000 [Pleodorina starrii]|uniref:FAD dependent oxidoreductase domain-containing protein n=1 Tax=Pleodorina starrii TaxID=330485 RepID=A0A9W6EYV2_9CHLO|nr:hypothetical protein PLESTM_000047700 [Pleodorina starrii]GLC50142.1 hypothetical protein PLESTB_000347000 [Pleodorina starrii]GLC73076.1 hypothetical protein PLESTF_001329300 [Pleodorina starrii]
MTCCHSQGGTRPQAQRCSAGRALPGRIRAGWALAHMPQHCRLSSTPSLLAASRAPTLSRRTASTTTAFAAATTVVERRAADVAVLGDSCIALAAAYSLARRGKKVILLPDLGLTAPRPPSEVFRPLHLPHPDAARVSLSSEAGAYWRGLQAQAAGSGLQLLTDCRSLDLGPLRGGGAGGEGSGGEAGEEAGEVLGRLQDACKAAGVRLGSLNGEQLSALFPALRLPGGVAGLLQPEGGVLNAAAARSLLLDLGERQGVLLRDRLVLRGWRDAGSHFVLRASGSLLPGAVSVLEVEQLLLAPAAEGGWPGQVLRMFGADVPALQVIQSSFGRCAAAPELTSLPVWRAIGVPPPTAGAAAASRDRQQQSGLLQVVSGLPARLAAPGSSSASLKLGVGLADGSGDAGSSSSAAVVVPGLDPWVWRPGSQDTSGLLSAHRLAGQLLRGVGPPLLLPPAHASGPAVPEPAWGDVALHVATPDGWPVLGFLPGLEPGRLLFASTASCSSGGDGTPTGAGYAAGPSRSRSAGPGSANSVPAEPGRATNGPQSQPQQQQQEAVSEQHASSLWLFGGRPVLADGYQLSPVLAKMAVDLLCGAARPAEVDLERLDVGRPALGAVARAEGLDPWEGLGRWQDGGAAREEAAAARGEDEAAERERAEARARGARMVGADAAAADEAAREAEERRRGAGPRVFTIKAPS